MDTTVSLQPPFEFYWWIILIAVLLLVIAIVLMILALNKVFHFLSFGKKKESPVIIRPAPRKLLAIKSDYAARLKELSKEYSEKAVDKRTAYQKLSILIRGFVQEVTGINVENFTKSEIKAFGIRKLDKLIEEYYVPEFAEDERSRSKDFIRSCNTALGVIQRWS